MKTSLAAVIALCLGSVAWADEPAPENAPAADEQPTTAPATAPTPQLQIAPPTPGDQPPDTLPRVKVTLRSAGEPLDVGLQRDTGDLRGTHFDIVCQTPCAVSMPAESASFARLQVRAPGSPGAALNLDAAALDGAKLTLQPPGRAGVRAGAALLTIGIITSVVGGVLIPYGRDLATRADVNPDAGMPGGGVTLGAGMASTIAGALLLATSRPKVRRIDKRAADHDAGRDTARAPLPVLHIPL